MRVVLAPKTCTVFQVSKLARAEFFLLSDTKSMNTRSYTIQIKKINAYSKIIDRVIQKLYANTSLSMNNDAKKHIL